MAQERIHDQNHSSAPKFFNRKFDDIIGKFVLSGFTVSKGSAAWKVTVGAGTALLDGVEIIETEDLEDILTLDPAHPTMDRYDVIALKYLFGEVLPPTTASLVVIKGESNNPPQKPALASDELELATILIPAGASDFLSSDISIPLKFRSRIAELVHRGVTTERKTPIDFNVLAWNTETDPRLLGYTVKHGDGWYPPGEDPPILRVYNEVLGAWVEKDHWDSIREKPEAFNPEQHDFYGDRHFGRRPLPEDEHDLRNITHQQMMAIPLVFTF